MKNFIVVLVVGGILSFLCLQACAEAPQDAASEYSVSVETLKTFTLLSYHMSDEQTVYLFSTRIIETYRWNGTQKQGQMVYSRLYVDVEDRATGQRRRVWQRKEPFMNPQAGFRSFAFGPADTEGRVCLGMASRYTVNYLLLDLESGVEGGEIPPPPVMSGLFHIEDLMVRKVLDAIGFGRMPDTTIQHISYSSTEGWKLGIKISVLNFDSMLPIELQGTPKRGEIQWSIKKLF